MQRSIVSIASSVPHRAAGRCFSGVTSEHLNRYTLTLAIFFWVSDKTVPEYGLPRGYQRPCKKVLQGGRATPQVRARAARDRPGPSSKSLHIYRLPCDFQRSREIFTCGLLAGPTSSTLHTPPPPKWTAGSGA